MFSATVRAISEIFSWSCAPRRALLKFRGTWGSLTLTCSGSSNSFRLGGGAGTVHHELRRSSALELVTPWLVSVNSIWIWIRRRGGVNRQQNGHGWISSSRWRSRNKLRSEQRSEWIKVSGVDEVGCWSDGRCRTCGVVEVGSSRR